MPTPYDDIMSLLHETDAFAKLERQEKVARSVRHARQIAEAEFLWDAAKQIPVQQRLNLAARTGTAANRLEAPR